MGIPNPSDTSLASQVWSITHIRSVILQHLSDDGLSRVLRLSKGNFIDATRILYQSIKYSQFNKLEFVCTSIARLRYYTRLIEHVDVIGEGNGGLTYNNLLNRFPSITSFNPYSGGSIHITEKSPDIFKSSKKPLLETKHMCTAENISNSARQSLKQHQFSTLFEYLEVDIKISECQIVVLDDEPRLKSIFKAWSENQGPFEFPIDTLIFTMMSIPSKSFLDEWAEFKNEQGENRRLPRKWCLAIDEHEEQPRIMSIIEELCTQVEELTLRSWHRDINGGYTVSLSSIQDFFNNPIRWPSNNILKSLDILLNLDGSVSSESSREIVFPAHNTEPINLQRLTITLDARDAHRHMGTYGTINNVIIQNIPPSAQIARAMLSIGGTGCHYDFKIITGYGEEIDGLGARVNADIKEEMMKIWDNDERSIGWTRIAKQKP